MGYLILFVATAIYLIFWKDMAVWQSLGVALLALSAVVVSSEAQRSRRNQRNQDADKPRESTDRTTAAGPSAASSPGEDLLTRILVNLFALFLTVGIGVYIAAKFEVDLKLAVAGSLIAGLLYLLYDRLTTSKTAVDRTIAEKQS